MELWNYFRSVIDWVEAIFPAYRKEMKGIGWGYLYNEHGDRTDLDPAVLENQISELMQDDEVTNKKGIYQYVLTGDPKSLNLRVFDDNMKHEAYERQEGICPQCGQHFDYEQMEETIFYRGRKVAKPPRKTAKCFAGNVTEPTQRTS